MALVPFFCVVPSAGKTTYNSGRPLFIKTMKVVIRLQLFYIYVCCKQDSRESIASYYSDAGDIAYSKVPITGEILFSLVYQYKTGMLEVGVKNCRDIAVADTRRNRSDPYVLNFFWLTKLLP